MGSREDGSGGRREGGAVGKKWSAKQLGGTVT